VQKIKTQNYLKRCKEKWGCRGEETTHQESWFLSPNITSGGESASRYRYIGEEAGSQGQNSGQANSSGGSPGNGEVQTNPQSLIPGNFHANSNADYRLVSPNRSRSSVTLFVKGEAVATNKNSYSTSTTSSSTGNRSGTTSASTKRSYFGTDMMGSVRSATHDDGLNANYYDYDVFGKPFGETSDYGYVGKPYDPVTGLSNYGYRDYSPKTARFTTVDPIRDGHNWYAYCSNDPINFVDLWGLELIITVDKDRQSISVEFTYNDVTIKEDFGDNSVTTGVVSQNSKPNTDTSRTQDSGGVKTNPTQFPNGTSTITGIKDNPIKKNDGTIDDRYGKTWITTDATQKLSVIDPKTGKAIEKTVVDGGYQIHFTPHSNTNGCIGILDDVLMDVLIGYVKLNERLDPNSSSIIVTGGKND